MSFDPCKYAVCSFVILTKIQTEGRGVEPLGGLGTTRLAT